MTVAVTLPERWPLHRGYALKVLPDGDNAITVKVTYPPKPRRTTRMKYRMRRFVRLVSAAGYRAGSQFVGRLNNPETFDAVADAVLGALRSTAQRHAHLKA